MSSLETLAKQVLSEKDYVSTEINGETYSIKLLPSTVGLSLATEVLQIISPLLGSFLDNKKDEFDVDSTMFTELGILLSDQLSKTDVLKFKDVLLKDALVNNSPLDVDKHLKGGKGLSVLFKLLKFAMKENIGDFLLEMLKEKGLEITSLEDMMSMGQTTQE